MSVKVNIEDTIEEKTEAEDNLVKLIISIKDNYGGGYVKDKLIGNEKNFIL
ncbi:MAG TPA: hypothetical protein IAB35_02925 [Candidatus Faecimonas gallistercoris]|nr:hypothetical protein [Candidatus Faecimonas gallistercoris]